MSWVTRDMSWVVESGGKVVEVTGYESAIDRL